MSDIAERVETVSMALVMADPSDLQALAELHEMLSQISALAVKGSEDVLAGAASASADLIKKIILDEVEDATAALGVVSRAVTSMQFITRDGRSADEVSFPRELGVGGAEASSPPGETSADSACEGNERAESVPEETAGSEQTSLLGADTDLLSDFVTEAREHLENADVQLLTLETDPQDADALNAVFRSFHTIKGVSGFLSLEDIKSLAHEAENLLDKARKGSLTLSGSAIDVVFESVDVMKRLVEGVAASLSTGEPLAREESLPELINAIRNAVSGGGGLSDAEEVEPVEGKKLGEILVEDGIATEQAVEGALREQNEEGEERKLGEILVEHKDAKAAEVAQALRRQQATVKETIKIDVDRVDRLVEMIGELVISNSMVNLDIETEGLSSLRLDKNLDYLTKTTRELQELGMSMRMVPVRSTFQKMARLSRDLARKAGKKVEFSMSGEETELDRGVVEKIADPLVHMIRNAVDHGIESAEERRKAGKPQAGRVELSAFHKGSNVFIQLEDDGKGLDREVLLAKARERGLVEDGDSMSDREVFNLIFAPGFSTAKKVTDVSGRGVGMDVVRRNIESLRGQVDIESVPGRGSTFTMRLPLTLAIIDGMVVQVGKEQYIIPTLSIMESLRPTRDMMSTVLDRGEMLTVRGQLMPMFRLNRLFALEGSEHDPTEALVVVIEDSGQQAALLVDHLIGQHQTVIKSLGQMFAAVKGVAGAAIMADGRVGLILDVAGLITLATSEEVDTGSRDGRGQERTSGAEPSSESSQQVVVEGSADTLHLASSSTQMEGGEGECRIAAV